MRYPSYAELAGRVAVVTGGTRGIGAETVHALARQGVAVGVLGRDEQAAEQVAKSVVAAGGAALAVPADCTDWYGLEGASAYVEEELGPVDILVAFAGGGVIKPGPMLDVSLSEWHSVVDNNLTATFLTVKAFVPAMVARGRGCVVTMASTAARVAAGAPAPYGAAKAGVVMLTRQLAQEVGGRGVRANCVAPSAVRTERTDRQMPPEVQQQVAALHPLGRLGEPADVAAATLFLASDSAGWLTGVTLDVAGGRIMT